MTKLALLLTALGSLSLGAAHSHAQAPAIMPRPTVMIVVEPNRTRIGGRELRAAINRSLEVIAVPVSFPRATESSAWIAISPAADGKVAMRVRRTNGRGASRVERAPREHTLEWLLEGVRWLLEASAPPSARAHPRMADSNDLDRDIRQLDRQPASATHTPMTSIEDLDRELAQGAETSSGGADALTAPTP